MSEQPEITAINRRYEETRPIEMFPGVVRRTLVSGRQVTLVEITLEAGALVPRHEHPHEQAGTVISGRIELEIGDQRSTPGPGSSYLIPGGAPHEVRAREATRLIEVFSPPREDFLDD